MSPIHQPDIAAATDAGEHPVQSRTVRTRGYEIDTGRTVPLPVLLSYLEHVRWETMQYPPLGLLPALARGHYFIVRGQVFELARSIGLGHEVELRCAVERVGRSSTWVLHDIVRPSDGALIGRARVHGVWMGPDRRPARIPDEMRAFAERHRDALTGLSDAWTRPQPAPAAVPDNSFLEPRERLHPLLGLELEPAQHVPQPAFVHETVVRPSDIDVFGHVNAATWVRLCEDARTLAGLAGAFGDATLEALACSRRSVRVAIVYLREAVLGDRLCLRVAAVDSGHARGAFDLEVVRHGEPDLPLCRARLETVPEP